MKILIVPAHPEPASLMNTMRDADVLQLQADGHDMRISDLYTAG